METMQEATSQNPIAMRQLLEAGVHFGHNTGRWNPKMKQFIFGARNGIHIIDLTHTVKLFRQAFNAVVDATSRGELVLFVGTKKQAQDVITDDATRAIKLFTARIADACIIGGKVYKERAHTRGAKDDDERVIHVSSGGDGPRVEMATGGRMYGDSEASASPSSDNKT